MYKFYMGLDRQRRPSLQSVKGGLGVALPVGQVHTGPAWHHLTVPGALDALGAHLARRTPGGFGDGHKQRESTSSRLDVLTV